MLRSYSIEVITLERLFKDYVGSRAVDLLSIDMEGLDTEPIMSFAFSDTRPLMICVEANSTNDRHNALTYLNQHGYRLVTDLGCNLIVENVL